MATRKNMDKQWQAEMDAHTLAEYQKIMDDDKRRKAAFNEAQKQIKSLQERTDAMQKVVKFGKGGRKR